MQQAPRFFADETQYFTPADGVVTFITHPDGQWRGVDLDVAFFRLTAGDTPLHVFNYARRPGMLTGRSVSGVQGGAAFDDTALSNRIVQLELVLNMTRFQDVRYALMPATSIGDVRVAYQPKSWAFDAAGARQDGLDGYYLRAGQVQKAGYEVSIRSATYPAVSVVFADYEPIVNGSAVTVWAADGTPAATAAAGLGAAAPDAAQAAPGTPTTRAFVDGFDFNYTLETGQHRRYTPQERYGIFVTAPYLTYVGTVTVDHTGDVAAAIGARAFQTALLVSGGRTWIWDPKRAGGPGYREIPGLRLDKNQAGAAQRLPPDGDQLKAVRQVLLGQ
jgi:hypothetical protein